MEIEKRRGILKIDDRILFESRQIFIEEFIVRGEHLIMTRQYIYYCFSALEPGEKVPTYEAIIHTDRVEFLEVKE